MYAARAVLPSMLERGSRYLLNVASAAGLLTTLVAARPAGGRPLGRRPAVDAASGTVITPEDVVQAEATGWPRTGSWSCCTLRAAHKDVALVGR